MSTQELNIDDHLNSVNSFSKQYCHIMRHLNGELSAAKTRITSLEATLKEKMIEQTQQIEQLRDGQSKLIQRIVALQIIESRNSNDVIDIEGNDDQKSSQLPSNTSDSKRNPSAVAFQYHMSYSTEEKQISSSVKTTPHKPHIKRVQLPMECVKLIEVMKQFNKTNRYDNKIDIKQILNDYLHVIHTYKDDHHFEAIVRELGVCDASKCKIFHRHYRDREATNVVDDARMQIMNTIHCYYQHCYDIGNRLSLKEQMLCDNSGENIENEFINHKIQNIRKILQKKHKYPANTRMRYNTTYKYEQLPLFSNQNQMKSAKQCGQCWKVEKGRIDTTDGVFYCNSCWNNYGNYDDGIHKNDTDSDMFHFGVRFEYKKEKNGYSHCDENENVYKICRKYKSLKDEMLNNTISTLNPNTFEQELSKAQIYYATAYRRRKYKKMSLDQILSLMIYCNYDTLQYLFSKTYRLSKTQHILDQHSNFYHFGSNLTTAVHSFGTVLKNNGKLYHGISQKMHFSSIVGTAGKGVSIYCPLSTTSEICVAAQFTNNEGLIVAFSSAGFCPKWFSVAWLSNYGNECEHLCIQNQYRVKISNIIDPSGFQHCSILSSLYVFSDVIADVDTDTDDMKIAKVYPLLKKLIQHRLSKESSDYDQFEELSEYGDQLLDIFCNNISQVNIPYSIPNACAELENSVWGLLCKSNDQHVKMGTICGLFSRLQLLQFRFISPIHHRNQQDVRCIRCNNAMAALLKDVCEYLLRNGDRTNYLRTISMTVTVTTGGCVWQKQFQESCKKMLIGSRWNMFNKRHEVKLHR